MFSFVRAETMRLLRRKATVTVFWCLMFFVLTNFVGNVLKEYSQIYVSQMFAIPKVLTFSTWSIAGIFVRLLYPMLVLVPTSLVFYQDSKINEKAYILSRIPGRKYYLGKTVSGFIVTFVLFVIPFFIEIFLSVICLESSANGDPAYIPLHDSITSQSSFLFLSGFYVKHRIIYSAMMILLFGIISGILAVFNMAFSILIRNKYSLFALVPVFALLMLSGNLYGRVTSFQTNYYSISSLFLKGRYDYGYYAALIVAILALTILIILFKQNKDDCL